MMIMASKFDLGNNWTMSCDVENGNARCVQSADDIPKVSDRESFMKMINACDLLDNTSDEKINEAACTTFSALVLKKDVSTITSMMKGGISLQKTNPCKWQPGKIDKKGRLVKFGACMPNKDQLTGLGFNVFYE